jgi:ubiquinone/menaquinone biosynthesis C-methylase UbiE
VDHADHVGLLRTGVLGGGMTWADLGSGEGAFTLALADLLGPSGVIFSVDRNERALRVQGAALLDMFPEATISPLVADFTTPLELPPLDGIVMANSLHFVRHKLDVLRRIRGYLRANGRLVVVEYDSDHGNPWVPYPLSFRTWAALSAEAGFRDTMRVGTVPSRFLGSMYAARSLA